MEERCKDPTGSNISCPNVVLCTAVHFYDGLFPSRRGLHVFLNTSLSCHSSSLPRRNFAPCRPKNATSPRPKLYPLSSCSALTSSLVPNKTSFTHSNLHALPRTRIGACPVPASGPAPNSCRGFTPALNPRVSVSLPRTRRAKSSIPHHPLYSFSVLGVSNLSPNPTSNIKNSTSCPAMWFAASLQ